MNKFEKLIEYIINDEDQKARELFHDIVVEKSRDIYEDIMGEENMEEKVEHDPANIVDEISAEETMKEEDDEFSVDGEDEAGNVEGDFPADAEHADAEEGNPEEEEIEHMVANVDAKLDELLAKFDEIMGHSDAAEMPGEEPGMEHDAEVPSEEPAMFEGENPFAKGSGKSGSAQSGKSGSAMSGKSGKSGSGKTESRKTATELMREYTEKIADINLNASTYSEGEPVGATGKKVAVNTKSEVGPGNNFGGDAVTSKGGNQNQDGTSPTKASNEYTKGEGEIKSGNVNVPGGKAGKPQSTGNEYSKEHPADGTAAGNDGKIPQNTKSVQVQNTGKK